MGAKGRKRLLVDAKVQRSFALRAIAYWAGCMTIVMGLAVLWQLLTKPAQPLFSSDEEMWACLRPLLLATILVMPTIIYDILVLTNRLVGPIVRLRSEMRKLARGEHVEPIRFRKGDFWQEFADEFNAVVARVQAASAAREAAALAADDIEAVPASESSRQEQVSPWARSPALVE